MNFVAVAVLAGVILTSNNSFVNDAEKLVSKILYPPQIVASDGSDSLYKSKNTDFEVKFGAEEDRRAIVFKKDSREVVFRIPSSELTWEEQESKIVAKLEERGLEYHYSLLDSGEGRETEIKEEIVLNQPMEENSFEFHIDIKGLIASREGNSWYFLDEEGKKRLYT